jgi:hypothetical protein
LVQLRENFAGGMERPAGVAERVAQFGRVGAWGKQVLGKTASKKTLIIMLFFPSLARGPGAFGRDETSTPAQSKPGDAEWSRRSLARTKGGAFFI